MIKIWNKIKFWFWWNFKATENQKYGWSSGVDAIDQTKK